MGLGPTELIIILTILIFMVGGTVFWLWMLVDCARKESNQGNNKIVWVIIIALTHWIGAAIYFFVRRPKRRAELGR